LHKNNSNVKEGDLILVTYSMKIESKISADKDGILKLFVKENDLFEEGKLLLSIE